MEHQGKLNLYRLNAAILLTCQIVRLTGDQVNSKRLLSTWTLHFAGKKTYEV